MDIVDPTVAAYAVAHTTALSSHLKSVADATQRDTTTPLLMTGFVEARLLEMLVVATDARIALDIGTFTGMSALALAAAMPPEGRVITLEYNGEVGALARANFAASPYGDRIELVVGDAHDALRDLRGPFDVVWIDAWKRDYVRYYEAVLPKLSRRGVIAADNVLWNGRVADPGDDDEIVRAMAAFNDHVQADARTRNTLLADGDGVMLAWRADPPA